MDSFKEQLLHVSGTVHERKKGIGLSGSEDAHRRYEDPRPVVSLDWGAVYILQVQNHWLSRLRWTSPSPLGPPVLGKSGAA